MTFPSISEVSSSVSPSSFRENGHVEDLSFDRTAVVKNGSKFMVGNGYMGFRGTLEEFSKGECVGCTLAGLYDQVSGSWREPVNAPNGLFLRISVEGCVLSPLETAVTAHRQWLDLRQAVHGRMTVFTLASGLEIKLTTERFLSLANVHVGALRCTVTTSRGCTLIVESGIDGDVWDLNGPHLADLRARATKDGLIVEGVTQEKRVSLAVAEAIEHELASFRETIVETDSAIVRRMEVTAKADVAQSLVKCFAVYTGRDGVLDVATAVTTTAQQALKTGYDGLLGESASLWHDRWARSDVQIEGDDAAQLALRYSLYQLLIVAPAHEDRVSIPARGLSGQVYKGGVFWDTEIFMLPFFNSTQPAIARNLTRYRYHTLDGARRKAAEYGFRGAFYAWESQDTGDDACTLYNVTDVFTGRPMRTYFRDKQIHISADVALAVWNHYQQTGDESVLIEGGAEVILECARFFISYACYKPEHGRYEILDVVGPDEYHERVDNNAFTNASVHATLGVALAALAWLETRHTEFYGTLVAKLDYDADRHRLKEIHARIFLPVSDCITNVIEQFSGYHRLEDTNLEVLRKRVLQPTEYWGGGNGVATGTKVIKQADVVLMLHLFGRGYSDETKLANWEYYEPRTEHGSSLSPCVYALVAARLGRVDWAYDYFLKTATIDLTGKSKQYIGPLYIGGTHPAANGGAWMAAVNGFGGLDFSDNGQIALTPHLPAHWNRLTFRFCRHGDWFTVSVTHENLVVTGEKANRQAARIHIADRDHLCRPGETIEVRPKKAASLS